MLTASRSLTRSIDSGKEMPKVPALRDLYGALELTLRQGQLIMIAGRPGSGKSVLALVLAAEWSRQGKSVLYHSGDMSAFDASTRLASLATGKTTREIEHQARTAEGKAEIASVLREFDISYSFDSPIRFHGIEEELEAYVEMRNAFPDVIVIDNLMDLESGDSDYSEQMFAMSAFTELARETGSTVIVLHHASDLRGDPMMPPARKDIKNGLAEKPEVSLSVAFDSARNDFRIAVIKQRGGKADPSGSTFALLKADMATSTLHAK